MSSTLDQPLPRLLEDVIVRPLGDEQGRHVVKNPARQTYLRIGEQEAFLLAQCDGRTTRSEAAVAFQSRFNEALDDDDILQFVKMVGDQGLISRSGRATRTTPKKSRPTNLRERVVEGVRQQNILYFRVKVFDPDQSLNWLEPRTRWLFSRWLAVMAAWGTLAATLLMWTHRHELFTQLMANLTWKTLAAAWLTTVVVTIAHEYGHGLACKRYGGEVREMGALWLFFTPCFYCNVSDAWLLSSRWQRLLISMAGTYVDLLIWIPSVFIWRLTMPGTTINFVAWLVATTCGLRVAFNINPLMRLDGYYAASDVLGIPNLRRRSRERWLEHVRWLCWGAPRPQPAADGSRLLWFGVFSWIFTVGFLGLLCFKISDYLMSFMGVGGLIAGLTLFVGLSKRYFRGALAGEFLEMFRTRRKRILIYAGVLAGLMLIPIRDRVGGAFRVRPAVRWEVRAPVAGFLRGVDADEGHAIHHGQPLFTFEIPELTSLIARKEAEIHESKANLRRLEAGPRPELLAEQRAKVRRAEAWRDLAESDLGRARRQLEQELAKLELQVSQTKLEADYQATVLKQAESLYQQGGLAGQQLMSQRKQSLAAETQRQQAEAASRARLATGVLEFESALASREKALADTKSDLILLEAGSRPEDIEAERARLQRLQEEAKHLAEMRVKQTVLAPATGLVTTPRLSEKIGQFLNKGDLICIVEDPGQLEAEIAITEQDARVLQLGQVTSLKARSLPFDRLNARVDRIAPAAADQTPKAGQAQQAQQNTVTVYCELENNDRQLRSGMTGYGRVYLGVRPLGWIILNRTIRLVRTEFWW